MDTSTGRRPSDKPDRGSDPTGTPRPTQGEMGTDAQLRGAHDLLDLVGVPRFIDDQQGGAFNLSLPDRLRSYIARVDAELITLRANQKKTRRRRNG